MKKIRWNRVTMYQQVVITILFFSVMGHVGVAQQTSKTNTQAEKPASKVVSVYGIEADDYLTRSKKVESVTFKAKKYARQRAGWSVPDVFYYVGGPIFFILLIRVIAYFITSLEEEHKEELKKSLREELVKESDNP